MWTTLFFIIGLIHLAYFVYAFVGFLRRNCLLKKMNLTERYGTGSWALVTGASDGIGAEFCIQLAREGFNICLVSRTRSKLESVERQVREANPKVETCTIQFDFTDATDMRQYERLC